MMADSDVWASAMTILRSVQHDHKTESGPGNLRAFP